MRDKSRARLTMGDPIAIPATVTRSASRNTIHRTFLCGAPSAMRMPISLVRPGDIESERAVEPDAGQYQRKNAESGAERRDQTVGVKRFVNLLAKRSDARDLDRAIERVNNRGERAG